MLCRLQYKIDKHSSLQIFHRIQEQNDLTILNAECGIFVDRKLTCQSPNNLEFGQWAFNIYFTYKYWHLYVLTKSCLPIQLLQLCHHLHQSSKNGITHQYYKIEYYCLHSKSTISRSAFLCWLMFQLTLISFFNHVLFREYFLPLFPRFIATVN